LAKARCRIYEVGISYNGRTYSEGKKVNWKDGFHAIYAIVRYNLFSWVELLSRNVPKLISDICPLTAGTARAIG